MKTISTPVWLAAMLLTTSAQASKPDKGATPATRAVLTLKPEDGET